MDDLISRKAAIDALNGVKVDENCDHDIGYNDGIILAVIELSFLPAVEPEKKTGKWIPENTSGPYYCQTFVCSECGEMTRITIMGEPRHRYCPHCGAKMEYDATN